MAASADIGGIGRLAARLNRYSADQLGKVQQRAAATVARRLPVEASRLASSRIFNVSNAKIRPLFSAQVTNRGGNKSVVLSGLRKRLPLHEFAGASWGGPKSKGAAVKVFQNGPARIYAGTFAKKSKGIQGGIFVRVPGAGRLPIARRKGPEIGKAIRDKQHGDIFPDLIEVGRDVFRGEIQRHLKG